MVASLLYLSVTTMRQALFVVKSRDDRLAEQHLHPADFLLFLCHNFFLGWWRWGSSMLIEAARNLEEDIDADVESARIDKDATGRVTASPRSGTAIAVDAWLQSTTTRPSIKRPRIPDGLLGRSFPAAAATDGRQYAEAVQHPQRFVRRRRINPQLVPGG